MSVANLPVPAKIGVSIAIGIASLVVLFVSSVVVLGQAGRLDYDRGVTALVVCCVSALAVSVVGAIGPVSAYITGQKREAFLTFATWATILLPIATVLESAVIRLSSYWWYMFPAQFMVGGLLGLAVAVSRRRLWWLLGAWGILATCWGMLWITAPFWAQ